MGVLNSRMVLKRTGKVRGNMGATFIAENITNTKDLEEVVILQEMVWGKAGVVPVPHLIAVIHNGGVVMRAVEKSSEQTVGFCYGFAGVDSGAKSICLLPYVGDTS